MIAVMATFAGFPAAIELVVFGLQVGVEPHGDERRHVEGLADAGPAAANEGAAGPASGLSGDRRKAGETCGLAGFEKAEFWHFNEQGEGGDLRDSRNARQYCEPLGEIRVGFE